MRLRTALPRRALIGAAFGGGAAWVGTAIGFFNARPPSSEHATLAALCSRLHCPPRLGEVCRQALPSAERSDHALARSLIADLRTANGGYFPAGRLARAIRQRSQDDFHAGRTVPVDGWILSLTETRLYALATMRSVRTSGDKRVTI